MREGDRIKSILTEKVYEVKTIKDWAVLTSVDGSSEVWTEIGNLKLFYKMVDDKGTPEDLAQSSAKSKPLRSPTRVAVDFV
jgi:hypothetical protein